MPLTRLIPGLLATAALLAPLAAVAQAPPQLSSFRALRGADFMDAQRYAEAPDRVIGRVTDIRGGDIDGRPGQEIALIGLNGIAFFPVTGGNPRNIQLFNTQGQPNTFMIGVDVNSDGVLEFLESGGDPNAPRFIPRAYGINGQPVWTKADALNPRRAMLFLADRIESPQFLVAEEGGLTLETMAGERLRRFPVTGSLTYMEKVDVDRDGNRDIVVLTDGRNITVLDQLGETITSGSLPVPTKMVTVTGFPNQRDHAYMVLCGEGEIGLFNFDGTLAVRLEAPFCSNALAALVVAHPVRLVAGESDFLAVLVQYPAWDRSLVYLYSPTGQLVYMRCVPGYVTSMNTLVLDNSGAEQLFTGGNGNIYINPVIGSLPRG